MVLDGLITNFLHNSTTLTSLASSGAVLGASGGIVYGVLNYLKRIPASAYSGSKRLAIREYTIISSKDNDAFIWFESFFHNHPRVKNSTRQMITTKFDVAEYPSEYGSNSKAITKKAPYAKTPSMNIHYFFFKGKLFWFRKSQDKLNNGFIYTYILSTFNTRRKVIDELLDKIYRDGSAAEKTDGIKIYTNDGQYWERSVVDRPVRQPNTVITKDNVHMNIIEDAKKFLESQDVYVKYGINYKRGYVLYGPPGTGKTSIILALATALNLPIYNLHLNDDMNDQQLNSCINNIRSPAICIIEDIDNIFNGRERHPNCNTNVTFKGLINVIDGIGAADGIIYIITTNNIQSLDPALLRAGRADIVQEIGLLNREESMKMLKSYISDPTPEELNTFNNEINDEDNVPASVHNHIFSILKQRNII